jgi:molybdopterin-containing oxidoreductase family iron-sulfur binding subunit
VTEEKRVQSERREFLKAASVTIGTLAATQLLFGEKDFPRKVRALEISALVSQELEHLPVSERESTLLKMQRELQKALKKPMEQRRWVMVIDLRKCIGCSACTISCNSENVLPPGVVYRPVVEEEIGEYPNVTRRFIPRPCMQCDNPPCVPVCPVSATWKRADGIVVVDYDVCIGCRYCIMACPYNARTFDFGERYTNGTPKEMAYETRPTFEYREQWPREPDRSPIGNARKCHFCIHRIESGMLPSCTTSCVGGATYFGDANDPNSLVSKLTGQPNVIRLREELGTKPRVYYLI